MGASSSKSSNKPVDMTPEAFKNLQGPFANVLNTMLGQYVPNSTGNIISGYQGPTTTPVGQNEQSLLNQLMTATGSNPGTANTGGGVEIGNSGQTVTDPGQTPATGTPTTQQGLLESTMQSGGSADEVANFVSQLGIGGEGQPSLQDFMSQLSGASGTGAFGGADSNPFSQAYIDQAQRQTMQNLEETLSRSLPGRFTQAGQMVQPQGSSAFDRAAAIATRGATQEMGDIATRISYQAMADAQAREASALEGELGRRGQQGLQTQQLEAGAQQNQLDRALGASEQQTQQELAGSQIQTQEVDNLIKNLQAQALPRLIQDLGVERGMEAFNNNVNSLLAVLGIGAGVTRPVIAQEGSSKSTGFQLK
jgi:hypothetical protein